MGESCSLLAAVCVWYNNGWIELAKRGDASVRRDQLQTMSIAFQQICAGERDWTALGNFMNYWYAYAKDRREELIRDPLPAYDEQSLYQHRWAVFCAAAVEWFCDKYQVPCPEWVYDPKYMLTDPWFLNPRQSARSWQLQMTPEEFRRRNVFCGDNCFDNKWEWAERFEQYQRQRMAELQG